jgi:hypothetical protein
MHPNVRRATRALQAGFLAHIVKGSMRRVEGRGELRVGDKPHECIFPQRPRP